MGKVHFELTASEAQAVGAFMKLVDAQGKAQAGFKKNIDESKRAAMATQGVVRQVGVIAAGLGIPMGIGQAISFINSGVQQWRQQMGEIAKLARETTTEMIAFSQVQEKGTTGARAREVAKMGVPYGMAPGAALSTFQMLQAQLGGKYGETAAAFEQVGRLKLGGVPIESAREAVLVGMGLGVSPGVAARAPYAAGIESARTPAEMAAAAGIALPAYRGIGGGLPFGYAVMSQLSSVVPAEQLGTYTARAGTGLTDLKFWKRYRFKEPGADPWKQLEFLAGKGWTTQQALQKAGLTEERETRALSILLADLPAFRARTERIKGMIAQPGIMGEQMRETETQLTQTRLAREIAATEAALAEEKVFGPRAIPGMQRELTLGRRRLLLQRRGQIGWARGPEGFGWWLAGLGRAAIAGERVVGAEEEWATTGRVDVEKMAREYVPGMNRAAIAESVIPDKQDLLKQFDALTAALRENSAVTRDNTKGESRTVRNAAGDE